MTSKRVLVGMLAGIALVALSATGAQAGNGGSPSPLTSFFVCNPISGEDAARRVDVDASTWGFNAKNVRLGNSVLMCAFAKLFPPQSQHIPCPGANCNEIEPNPGLDLAKQNLKCYSVAVPPRNLPTPPASFTVTDELVGTTNEDVTGSALQYICAPASLLQNP
jgi:hypothetical protein